MPSEDVSTPGGIIARAGAASVLFLVFSFSGRVFSEQEQVLKESEAIATNIYWNNGVHFRSNNDNFEMKIGGRLQVDAAAFDSDNSTKLAFPDLVDDAVEIRRIRLYTEGLLFHDYGFKFQFDFAYIGSKVTEDFLYKDLYVDRRNIPYLGTLRVGHQFEPFSLEDETSTKYISFMERALSTLAFDPDRNTGVLLFNTPLNNRLWWGTGVFLPVEDDKPFEVKSHSGCNVSGRIAGLPWYEDQTRLLHLGLSYVHKFRSKSTAESNQLEFEATPEAHLATPMIHTGSIISDGADIYNSSLALVLGPFSVQGEYYDAHVNSTNGPNLHFNGYYGFASYFLTGESRPYSTSEASFGRMTPKRPFSLNGGGWGAWEVGLRYSYLDLNDETIQGGEQRNITAGLNWYLNQTALFRFNYVYAHVEDSNAGSEYLSDGNTRIYQMRFQLDF
jgi:phosphate-selective porin OprO/OprP